MRQTFERLFLAHPHSVDESYGEHFRFAFGFGLELLGAALAALAHAMLPFLFQTTASLTVKRLHARIMSRGVAAPASVAPAARDLQDLCPQI